MISLCNQRRMLHVISDGSFGHQEARRVAGILANQGEIPLSAGNLGFLLGAACEVWIAGTHTPINFVNSAFAVVYLLYIHLRYKFPGSSVWYGKPLMEGSLKVASSASMSSLYICTNPGGLIYKNRFNIRELHSY